MAMLAGTQNESNRTVWIENQLKKLPVGLRILDAGAGEQKYRKFCSHLEYVSQDFAQYCGTGDCKGLQTGSWNQSNLDIISDITEIPEPDASFGAIMCVEVFEHLPSPIQAIREFRRLLKQNGFLILTAPFCSLSHFSPYHFYSGFSRYFYQTHLIQNGFEILELSSNGNFFEYLSQEINRIPFVASKFTGNHASFIEQQALKLALNMLKRMSINDQGSDELLCFGYHVLAQKVSDDHS